MKCLIALAVFVAVLPAADLSADQPLAWPRFRGPGGSGVADDQKPPVELGPDKNVKWKVPAPGGFSSPIVAGDSIIVTAFEEGKLYTIAYRRTDGKEKWRADAQAREIEGYYPAQGSPAASTAATDGQRVAVYFGSCGLICYDLSGRQLWKVEMPPAGGDGSFGSGVSPIIAEGLVILVRDVPQEAKILAFDVATGSPQWEKNRQSPVSYSTPVIWDTPRGKQLVVAGHAQMIGYDLATGEEQWSVQGLPSACCPSPVISQETLFFAGWSPGADPEFQMPAFDALLKEGDANGDEELSREESGKTFLKDFFVGNDPNKDGKITRQEWDGVLKFMSEGKSIAFALQAGGTGDVTDSHVLWKQSKGLPHVPSAIFYRGQYVMIKDGGIVTAYDAKTGDEVYMKRAAAAGSYYASPVAANGHIYLTSLDEGIVTVLKAGSDEAQVVAKNAPLGERVAATPAIADDTLYIRGEKHLYAFADEE